MIGATELPSSPAICCCAWPDPLSSQSICAISPVDCCDSTAPLPSAGGKAATAASEEGRGAGALPSSEAPNGDDNDRSTSRRRRSRGLHLAAGRLGPRSALGALVCTVHRSTCAHDRGAGGRGRGVGGGGWGRSNKALGPSVKKEKASLERPFSLSFSLFLSPAPSFLALTLLIPSPSQQKILPSLFLSLSLSFFFLSFFLSFLSFPCLVTLQPRASFSHAPLCPSFFLRALEAAQLVSKAKVGKALCLR